MTNENQTIRLYLSKTKYKRKPKQKQISLLNSEFFNKGIQEITVPEYAEKLGQGYSTLLAEYPENQQTRKQSDLIVQQQVVMLDFDNTDPKNIVSLKSILHSPIVQKFASFGYYTLSHKSMSVPKFRIVFILDQPVLDKEDIYKIYLALLKYYPMADQTVGQSNRMFFGGKLPFPIKYKDRQSYENRLPVDYFLEHVYSQSIKSVKSSDKYFHPAYKDYFNNLEQSEIVEQHGKYQDSKTMVADQNAFINDLMNPELIGKEITEKLMCKGSFDNIQTSTESLIENLSLHDILQQGLFSEFARRKAHLLGNKTFKNEFQAFIYFNQLDMRLLFDFPSESFIDIFHDESNPSARIYVNQQTGFSIYKCFSESNNLYLNVVDLLSKFLNIHHKRKTIKMLCEMLNCKIDYRYKTGEAQFNRNVFQELLEKKILSNVYPNIYKLIKRQEYMCYAVIEEISNNIYIENLHKLNYRMFKSKDKILDAIKNSEPNMRIGLGSLETTLNVLNTLGLIEKIPFKSLEPSIKFIIHNPDYPYRRVNVFNLSDFSFETMEKAEELAREMIEDKLTAGAISYKSLCSTFNEQFARTVFPYANIKQKNNKKVDPKKKPEKPRQRTSKKHQLYLQQPLDDVSLEILEKGSKYIMKQLDRKGYVLEQDVINYLAKLPTLTNNKESLRYALRQLRSTVIATYGITKDRYSYTFLEQFNKKKPRHHRIRLSEHSKHSQLNVYSYERLQKD